MEFDALRRAFGAVAAQRHLGHVESEQGRIIMLLFNPVMSQAEE